MSEPSWLDYANAAHNVRQTQQLSEQTRQVDELKRRLSALSAIQEQGLRNAQQEGELRQYIFDSEVEFEPFLQTAEAHPKSAYFMAWNLQRGLDEVGITPSTFREFVDKDRVRAFRGTLTKVMEECEARLNTDQFAKVSTAIRFIEEGSALREMIVAAEASERVMELNVEIASMSNAHTQMTESLKAKNLVQAKKAAEQRSIVTANVVRRSKENRRLLIFSIVATLLGLALLMIAGYGTYLFFGLLVVAMSGVVGYVTLKALSTNHVPAPDPRIKQLEALRTATFANMPPQERLAYLSSLFGANKTSAEYKLMHDQRSKEAEQLMLD